MSKKSSTPAQSTKPAQVAQPTPVATPSQKVKPPVKVASGRKFLNEAFVRSVLKDTSLNKTTYNQVTPVALKYLVSNFSLLEDSLRFVLKGSGQYMADGKSPRNTKLSDTVSKTSTQFFMDSMRDQASLFEAHVQGLVSSSLSSDGESFTNKVIRRIISDFLNAIPEHLATLQKKSSKTLDLTHVLLALNGDNRSLPLRFVSNLFPSFIGIPYNVADKGRIVPAEAFLQKCAFEGRKKREAYTVLRWYLGYVVDQLSSSDNFYLDALTKITGATKSTTNRNLVISFSSVILHGVNGCAGTQDMISRISYVESSINSGSLEQFGTFVKVEQPAESEKAEKKQKAPKKSKKETKAEVAQEAQPSQPTQSLEHNAKTLKPSPSKKKSTAASSQ